MENWTKRRNNVDNGFRGFHSNVPKAAFMGHQDTCPRLLAGTALREGDAHGAEALRAGFVAEGRADAGAAGAEVQPFAVFQQIP